MTLNTVFHHFVYKRCFVGYTSDQQEKDESVERDVLTFVQQNPDGGMSINELSEACLVRYPWRRSLDDDPYAELTLATMRLISKGRLAITNEGIFCA